MWGLWKSTRRFKTHLRLGEILQDHFMSDWSRYPLTSLIQALLAPPYITFCGCVASDQGLIFSHTRCPRPFFIPFFFFFETSFCLRVTCDSSLTLPLDVLILHCEATFFWCLAPMHLIDGRLGLESLTGPILTAALVSMSATGSRSCWRDLRVLLLGVW